MTSWSKHAGRERDDAIVVENITKKYGDFTAVDGVSFSVKDGEIFGLLGPNGAGKSTLIRMMTTLIPITAGKAFINGYDVQSDPDAARRSMGVIPQAMTSDIDLTVEENLNIYAKLYGVPAAQRKRNVDELLEAVDLTKWRGAQTKTLSGGMRRRAEIARGLVHSPKIFFLDEPTTGLDPVSRVAVWEMLNNLKSQRQLTILITTHYMDEADRLCDRVAIVDHGKLVALDSPQALKESVPGTQCHRSAVRQASGWLGAEAARVAARDQRAGAERRHVSRALRQRLEHDHSPGCDGGGSGSRGEILERAEHHPRRCFCSLHRTPAPRRAGKGLRLRDAATGRGCGHEQDVCDCGARAAEVLSLAGADAGFDGVSAGAVDHPWQRLRRQDSAMPEWAWSIRITAPRRCASARRSIRLPPTSGRSSPFITTTTSGRSEDVRTGKLDGAVIIPPQFSSKFYEQNHPRLGLVVDNSDQFMSTSLEQKMQELTDSLNSPTVPARIPKDIALEIVELYPYIEYMKYLLPGSIALAMFVSVMIGGGMLYIDDKARGVHEGFLVTPITRLELVLGLITAGSIKAVLSGVVITTIGSLLAGVSTIFDPWSIVQLLVLIFATSIAFNSMMFLMMVRVEDPLVPRAMFGILNTLLFFPSGSIYPINAFPKWLQVIARADPFTYAVHGFKGVLLKEAGFAAILPDVLFLSIFGATMLFFATLLFKRTL